MMALARQVPEKYLQEAVDRLLEIKEAADAERTKTTVCCLYCGSSKIEIDADNKDRHFYVCKECGEAFNGRTSAEMAQSPCKDDMWRLMIEYTVSGVSLEEASQGVGLSHSTVYRMRNKILSCALTNILEDAPTLKTVCDRDKYERFKRNLENIKGRKKVSATYLSRYAALFPQIVEDRPAAADKIFELMTARTEGVS